MVCIKVAPSVDVIGMSPVNVKVGSTSTVSLIFCVFSSFVFSGTSNIVMIKPDKIHTDRVKLTPTIP